MALKVKKEVEKSTVSEPITEEELDALNSQVEEEKKQISTKKMEAVVALVQEEFVLSDKGYIVTAFADKGNKSVISLSCEDFDITVTIKDNEKFGIF